MPKSHDKIANRLGLILTKFNNGEKLNIDTLVKEFGVSKRTIQRDLNERLSYLPIEKEDVYYKLNSHALGKLTYQDIKSFAIISGIKSLYPSLSNDFILDILNSKINKAFLIKNQGYEDISFRNDEFETISVCIIKQEQLSFFYNNKKRVINPYKLVNNNGLWYLVADENDKLKTYSFNKIKLLRRLNIKFENNDKFIQIINENKVNWFSKDELEVTLELDNSIAEFFFRKNILANYEVLYKSKNKIILITKVSYENEILSVIKYWIPNIRILSPLNLQEKLEKTLLDYVGGDKT